MRCFFNLVSDHDVILDDTGIEVPDLQTAKIEAAKAIRELRQELSAAKEDWVGWRLEIVCANGNVLHSMDLTISFH
jgi:molybdopterin converting factor small subunit